MNPSALQTLSSIAIFVGVVIAGLGGLGQYYFGHKLAENKDAAAAVKEKELNVSIESLLKGNKDLQDRLDPFLEIAQAKFPDADTQTALKRLSDEIDKLETHTRITAFVSDGNSREIMPDGTYVFNLKLNPVGKNIIPIFSISCKTEGGAVIKSFDVKGPTLPGMSFDKTSEDRTFIQKEYRSMYPGEVNVRIVTDKDPGRLNISIDPLQKGLVK